MLASRVFCLASMSNHAFPDRPALNWIAARIYAREKLGMYIEMRSTVILRILNILCPPSLQPLWLPGTCQITMHRSRRESAYQLEENSQSHNHVQSRWEIEYRVDSISRWQISATKSALDSAVKRDLQSNPTSSGSSQSFRPARPH